MRQFIYKYMLNNYLIVNQNYVIEEYNENFRLHFNWNADQYIGENLFKNKELFQLTIFLDELKYKTIIQNYQLTLHNNSYSIKGVWIAKDNIFLIQIIKEIK